MPSLDPKWPLAGHYRSGIITSNWSSNWYNGPEGMKAKHCGFVASQSIINHVYVSCIFPLSRVWNMPGEYVAKLLLSGNIGLSIMSSQCVSVCAVVCLCLFVSSVFLRTIIIRRQNTTDIFMNIDCVRRPIYVWPKYGHL
jgi:hypothetical protein